MTLSFGQYKLIANEISQMKHEISDDSSSGFDRLIFDWRRRVCTRCVEPWNEHYIEVSRESQSEL